MENDWQKYAIPHIIASMTYLISNNMLLVSRNPFRWVSNLKKEYFLTPHGNWGIKYVFSWKIVAINKKNVIKRY